MILIVGPSLSGKSTLRKKICDLFGYNSLVTVTTRQPRRDEVDGKDYYFYSLDRFDDELSRGMFMVSVQHGENMYGMLNKSPDELRYGNYVAVLNSVGAEFMMNWLGQEHLVTVFLHKPDGQTERDVPEDYEARQKHEVKDVNFPFDFTFYDYCMDSDIEEIVRYDGKLKSIHNVRK